MQNITKQWEINEDEREKENKRRMKQKQMDLKVYQVNNITTRDREGGEGILINFGTSILPM